MSAASMRSAWVRAIVMPGRFEGAILVLVLVALGFVLVRAHWSSIWMDREFTGGIGPLANRLVDGERLYTDGMHSPLPPLSFVLMRLLGGGNGGWLTGSAVNYLFQALTLGVMWLALRHVFEARVAFVATLCAVPVFLALPKAVVYDPMVQFCVALAALIVATLPARWPILLGVVCGVAALTKQSTAAGVIGGVALALLITSMAGRPFTPGWWRAVGAYVGSLVVTVGVALLALAPWADPRGFFHDVVFTGAEAKGDQADAIGKLREWGDEVLVFGLIFTAAVVLVVVAGRRLRHGWGGTVSWWRASREPDGESVAGLSLAGAAVVGGALGALSWLLDSTRVADPWITAGEVDLDIIRYRYTGTFAAVLVTALVVLWADRRKPGEPAKRFLRVFFVLAPAAFMMSLSSPELRWTYDNNPLVPFAFACLIAAAVWAAARLGTGRPWRRAVCTATATAVISALAWASLGDQIWLARDATDSWPEIEHLNGARLRPESAGMRALVADVRDLAGPDERVLLLPEDPNVQAWFERPRPDLTSAMVFPDQYWDRYVDEDFERLSSDPPKVVVIGPRFYWRPFSRLVHERRGAERLVDRVRSELLDERYVRAPAVMIRRHPILYGRPFEVDWMDVWVRR